MLRITPPGSSGGVSVKEVVVLRVGVCGNQLDWLNSLAEGKRLLEDHVRIIVINRAGVVVWMALEDFDLSEVVVAAPVVGAVSYDDTVGIEDTVSGRDDVLGATDGAAAHMRTGLTELHSSLRDLPWELTLCGLKMN